VILPIHEVARVAFVVQVVDALSVKTMDWPQMLRD